MTRIPSLPSRAAIITLALLPLPAASAQSFPVRAAVLPHVDPVPGVPGAIFSNNASPTQLDAAGRVSFVGAISSPNLTGVWSEGSGVLRLIALQGAAAPAPGLPAAVFPTFSGTRLVMSDTNRVAFVQQANPGSLTGVWLHDGSNLVCVALHGQPAPPASPSGLWELNNNLPTLALGAAGAVAFKAGVSTPQSADAYSALFSGEPGFLAMCDRTGVNQSAGFISFGEVQLSDVGRLGFATSVRLEGGSSVSGIFEGPCGPPATLAVTNQLIAADGLPAGLTYQLPRAPSFGQPSAAAFITGLAGAGVTNSNNSAIVLIDALGQHLVAREGDPVPGLPGAVYADFTNGSLVGPLMSASGHVAFLCTIAGPAVASDTNRVLLLRRPDAVVRVLARLGDTPPTYPASTVILGFGSGNFAINASGAIAFQLSLFGAPADRGGSLILASTPAGDASILLESGAVRTVRPGLDLRILDALSGPQLSNGHDGRPHNWNDAGQLAFRANYASTASPNVSLGVGVFVVGSPSTPSCPADFNADGAVDPDDLSDFIACYFAHPPCPQADLNADGAIDPDDLSDYIAVFFGGC